MSDPQTVPTQEKRAYRSWVGVVLSLFVTGAAQFLTGQRRIGLAWFLGGFLLQVFGAFWLASRWFPGIVPGFAIGAAAFVLWIVMLVKSCRPVQRLAPRAWLIFIILAVMLPLAERRLVRAFIQTFVVPTGGMAPTIQGRMTRENGEESGGDRLWVEKYAYWLAEPRRGDIVVFTTTGISASLPADHYVKRVVGIPGDVLTIRERRLLNHGKPVAEPAVVAELVITNPPGVNPALLPSPDTPRAADSASDLRLPPGHYFVMGDNTGNSFDSRIWGTVPKSNILGRVS